MPNRSSGMSKDRAHRIMEECLRLTEGADRERFLDEQCGGDFDLRRRVEKLLAELEKATVAQSSGLAAPDSPAVAERESAAGGTLQYFALAIGHTGNTIGPYKLEKMLGEGGFGAVWQASQREPVRRKVALKLLKAGVATDEMLARFEAERQALALMEHPGIAKVFDAGVTDYGSPYFVMELVAGEPLIKYCDSRGLDLDERLKLFAAVCQAIQHAHQKGIIHRDLKPSNILVSELDGQAQIKVIDFGIAKATELKLTEQTIQTLAGHFVGTPAYMSPEQAAGLADIDTRSDIYSLGIILFELITGTLPIDAAELNQDGLVTALRRIREEQAPRPSTRLTALPVEKRQQICSNRGTDPDTLARRLRGELDWIVAKALEKERERRYESAAALCADVTAFLERRAVAARPPTAAYQLRVFARRNRALVGGVAAVILSLALGIAGMTKLFFDAEAARERAAEESEKARQSAAVARAVNEFLTRDILGRGNPTIEVNGELTIRQAVQEAAARLDGQFTNQPLVEASIRYTVGRSLMMMGDWQQAPRHLERAYELQQKLLPEDHPDRLNTMFQLGRAWRREGQYAKARDILIKAIELQTRRDDCDPEVLAAAVYSLGNACNAMRDFTQAEKYHRKALELITQQGLKPPALVLSALASHETRHGNHEAARRLLTESLDRAIATGGEEHIYSLVIMRFLSSAHYQLGSTNEGFALIKRACELSRRSLGDSNPETLHAMLAYANRLNQLGRYEDSLPLLETIAEQRRKVLGWRFGTLQAYGTLGRICFKLKRYDESVATLEQLVQHIPEAEAVDGELVRRSSRGWRASYAESLEKQAEQLVAAGQFEAAHEKYLQAAREILLSGSTGSKERLGKTLKDFYARWGNCEVALEAIRTNTVLTKPHRNALMGVARKEAQALFKAGEYARAEPLARSLLDLASSDRVSADPGVRFQYMHLLGNILRRTDRQAEAIPLLQAVSRQWDEENGETSNSAMSARYDLAAAQKDVDPFAAEQTIRAQIRHRKAKKPFNRRALNGDTSMLGQILRLKAAELEKRDQIESAEAAWIEQFKVAVECHALGGAAPGNSARMVRDFYMRQGRKEDAARWGDWKARMGEVEGELKGGSGSQRYTDSR